MNRAKRRFVLLIILSKPIAITINIGNKRGRARCVEKGSPDKDAGMGVIINNNIKYLISNFFLLSHKVYDPTLVLYAMGFRYDFPTQSIRQVGMITINDVYPEESDLFLNSEWLSRKGSFRIGDLVPGSYNLKLAKEGYHSWEKYLTVESRLATPVESVILFPINPEGRKIFNSDVSEAILSPDNNHLLFSSHGEILLFSLSDQSTETVFPKNQSRSEVEGFHYSISDLAWSMNSDNVLFCLTIDASSDYYVLNTKSKKSVRISELFEHEAQKIAFISNSDLLVLSNNTLYSLNLKSGRTTPVTSDEKVLSFAIENSNDIFYIAELDTSTKNKSIKLKGLEYSSLSSYVPTTEITELPFAKTYRIILSSRNDILVLTDNGDLYLFNKLTNDLIELANQVQEVSWSPDASGIALTDGHELRFIDYLSFLKKDQTKLVPALLARFSKQVEGFTWHPGNNYLLLNISGDLRVIETDIRDRINTIDLLPDADIKNLPLEISREGDILFYTDRETGSLYYLSLIY